MDAGADLIFLEAPQSNDELRYYASELVPLGIKISANMLDGGRIPLVTFKELEDFWGSRCNVPVMPTYAAAMGLQNALEKMMTDGHNRNLSDLIIPFSDFNMIIGLSMIRELEERFLTESEIEKKYGSKEQFEQEKAEGR